MERERGGEGGREVKMEGGREEVSRRANRQG